MASDKKTKASSAPKAEPSMKKDAAVKKETSATPETKAEPKDSTAGAEPTKVEGGEKATDKPSNYSRGEGQKAVTQEYKDNWNAIFAKKKKR
jgi:hypothetical protein